MLLIPFSNSGLRKQSLLSLPWFFQITSIGKTKPESACLERTTNYYMQYKRIGQRWWSENIIICFYIDSVPKPKVYFLQFQENI